jgi:hypothetical protein
MGPIFHFAQYVKAMQAAERERLEPGPERIAAALADGGRREFETHPDVQELVASLRGWYEE